MNMESVRSNIQRASRAVRTAAPNVGSTERWLSLGLGAALIAWAASRRSRGGAAAGLVGLALAGRGVTGQCMAYRSLGIDTARHGGRPKGIAGGTPRRRDGYRIVKSLTVQRPREAVHKVLSDGEAVRGAFRRLEIAPGVGPHEVTWHIAGPWRKMRLEGVVELIPQAEAGESFEWRSLPESAMATEGRLELVKLGDDATELRLTLTIQSPFGAFGRMATEALGMAIDQYVKDELRALKLLVEARLAPATSETKEGVDASSTSDLNVSA